MPKYESIYEAIEQNERQSCRAPECVRPRIGISPYCLRHRKAHSFYGHPLQAKLHASRHAAEREQVAEIFSCNRDHPGILAAVQWTQQWMDNALSRSKETVAAEDLRRLQNSGVTAREIVIEAAAFYIYQQNNKHKFFNDAAEDIALSLAVLGLAPLGKKTTYLPNGATGSTRINIKSSPRKKVGRYIRSHLLHLFINLQQVIRANRDAALSTRQAMQSPLIYPTELIANKEPNV